jgi:hypothetical protein
VFVTSDGHAYARFRRAIVARQAPQALAAASELRRMSLEDALELCVLLSVDDQRRYEAAARRWLERFARERRASLQQILMAGAALAELGRSPASEVARDTLEQLLEPPG